MKSRLLRDSNRYNLKIPLLLGVPLGSYISQIIRQKIPTADPLVCGYTLMASVPVLFSGFYMARYNLDACYGLTFLAGIF